MVMTKSYSIGTTAKVLNLKDEFQGGNFGARGKRRVKIDFNADDIYLDSGKFAKKSEKVYTPASAINGTGVNDILSTLSFATAVSEDLHDGLQVLLRGGATELGMVRVIKISDDRKVVTVSKLKEFTYPATPLLVLAPSAKFMNGDSMTYDFDMNEVISLVAGTAGTNNVSMTLLNDNYNIN